MKRYTARKYTAYVDTGTDYITTEFESEHRKGSKANMEDCKNAMARRYGWTAHRWRILNITRAVD